jgi:vancomycin permeability regulator SanA
MNQKTSTADRLKNSSLWINAARGLALFIGSFALAGALTTLVSRFDPNIWWVDLRWLPVPVRALTTGLFGLAMITFAFVPGIRSVCRQFSLGITGLFLAFTFINIVSFGFLYATGRFAAGIVLPFSLFVHIAIWAVFTAMFHLNRTTVTRFQPIPFMMAVLAAGVTFPLLQVYCFGKTDYERRADTAIVFGARVYRDGHMSMALRDRVTRACALYEEGRVSRLIFSGGPGDGKTHETEAMRDYAIKSGIPAVAIWLDDQGLNTESTVANSLAMLQANQQFGRIIAVSKFYHLPRIKLTFQAHGRDVLTVPARPSHPSRNYAFRSILREIPAFWVYLARSVSNNVFS